MSIQFCSHTSPHARVFPVSPPSLPPAYRTVQNRFQIISTTCLFNIFLALTVITLLLLIAAITGLTFEVHETRKQCVRALNAKLLLKETFWVELAIPVYHFGFLASTITNTLPKQILIPCYFCHVRTHQIPIAFRPESPFSLHQLSRDYRLEGIHYHQHSETKPLVQFFPNTNHPNHIRSTSSFFPILAQIWRIYIEFVSHYFTDPLAIVFPGSGSSQLDNLRS